MDISIKLNRDDVVMLIDTLHEEVGVSVVIGSMSYEGLNVDVTYDYIDVRPRIVHVDYNGMDVSLLNEAEFLYELREELYRRAMALKRLDMSQIDALVSNLKMSEFFDFYQFSSYIENFDVSFKLSKMDDTNTAYDYTLYSNGTMIDELVVNDELLYERLVAKAVSLI